MALEIIVDSLEKKPYWTKGIKRLRLNVGDYTTKSLHNVYHIERKSLQDLYGTLTKGKIRFLNEIHRARRANIKMEIVVEGTKLAFMNKQWPNGHMRDCPSETLERRLNDIERMGCAVYWCSSRGAAKYRVHRMLKQKEKLYES